MNEGSLKLPPLWPGSMPTTMPASGRVVAAEAEAVGSPAAGWGAASARALRSEARAWVPITSANLAVCKARGVKRIVLLDDYQGIALDYGGWDRVPEEWQLVALEQHLAEPDALVEALADAEIVVAMRERTALPAEILDRLPELKLLVTTGMANVAIDF